jgi:uncharacterized membrane protein YhaH (DUF805 family)
MERAVDWSSLFLSLDGRIGRRAFWLGFIVVGAGLIAADVISRVISPSVGISVFLSLVLVYPLVAVVVKRLHDRGRSGWWAALLAAPLGAGVAAAYATRLFGLGEVVIQHAATTGIWAGLAAVVALVIVELGCRRGKPGYSEHGPPPLA